MKVMLMHTTEKHVRVLIVDDHPFMRRGLAQTINDMDEMTVCGEASDKAEGLQKVEELTPDLVVVDISLGDGSGIELIKEIKSRWPNTKMLVSSMHDESLFAERAIRAGALGFVNKGESSETFVEALRKVKDGNIFLSSRMTDYVLNQFVNSPEEPRKSRIDSLSDREIEVFELIGRGMITKQIAAKLELSPKTVETYREHIKMKLNLANGTELTRHAVQWVLEQG
jgi:DNA-binding NarL/FixJ family response regulator